MQNWHACDNKRVNHRETIMRKTSKEKLRPTPAQERVMEDVLGCCRVL